MVILLINDQLLWWNFWSNTGPRSEQDRQDHDPIEAGSFVESDWIEKSWADEKLVIRSLFHSDRLVSGIGPRISGLILGLRPANDRRRYFRLSLAGRKPRISPEICKLNVHWLDRQFFYNIFFWIKYHPCLISSCVFCMKFRVILAVFLYKQN